MKSVDVSALKKTEQMRLTAAAVFLLLLFLAPFSTVWAEALAEVGAGGLHTCGVRSDGDVACWGDNSYGQATPPEGTFTAVSAGSYHTCGVKTDGTIACWGSNESNQATPPEGTFTAVSAGSYHTCGVKTDGTIACWGSNESNQATPPEGTFTEVSAGGLHTCGVKTDGKVACWGDNSYGQAMPPTGIFTEVSAGILHTCGVKTDGTIACWGDDAYGQATPLEGTFTEVSAGGYYTCGVQTDGTVTCWGRNEDGESTAPTGTFREVSAGSWHTCGVETDGRVTCWGRNDYGQLMASSGTFSREVVGAGGYHTCEVKTDGTVACWGDNSYGQTTPLAGTFRDMSAGHFHTCGVKTDGTAACWGDNSYGQTTPPSGIFREADGGGGHTCGVKTDGTVACWGRNNYGQSTPPSGTFRQVSAGGYHTCGVKTNGTVVCRGRNNFGQSIPPTGTFTEASAGDLHTCGVKTDGTVACWGSNSYGQSMPPSGTFREVKSGGGHTCGVKTDGTVSCWGDNSYGQATPPAGTFTEVSAGYYHTCGVKTNGTTYCWGNDDSGQAPVVRVSPPTLPGGIEGTPYSQIITASGGMLPYTFKIISGSLPPGLSLTTRGILSGTPGSTGGFTIGVQAVDINNIAGEKTYTLTVKEDTPPTLGTLTPSELVSAPGTAQTFTAIYSDADGYGNIKQAYLRVGNAANGIYLKYDRTTRKLYLYDDAGTVTVGSCLPGGTGTLTNTQGSLNCAATAVSVLGSDLTIKWNMTPKAVFASETKKDIYMFVRDMSNATAGWTDKGKWTIKATSIPPTLGKLTPSALTSTPDIAQTFTAIYSDADGYGNIKQAYLRVGNTANGIYLRYDSATNKLYLYNDAGTGPVSSCTPGKNGVILTNTQGSLNCAATAVSVSGSDLTIKWNITPKAAFASATKRDLYMFVRDMSDATAGWTDKGDWLINTPPTLGTLTPSALTSAPGVAQTFTAIYSDADGYGNIKLARLRVYAAAHGIDLKYDNTTNKLYLYNDADTAAVGGCTPGSGVILTNTQGSLNCEATTVTGSGSDLTINWNVTPKAAFASATKRDLYMFVRDMSNAAAGWTDKGDWTITP